jgi:5-formyltetrahydrofolate cyclo-ligase
VKSSLRKSILAKRKALSELQVKQKSDSIFRQWEPLLRPDSHRTVHTFLSISAFREVDTEPFITHLQAFGHIEIGVPRVDLKTKEVTHHVYCQHELVKSSWGILEPPEHARRLDSEQFDMVLVPMLAFDRFGHRVGYGGGYYDKFLAQIRPDCLRIGLCFDMGYIESELPAQPHDVPLHGVLTETRYHKLGTP